MKAIIESVEFKDSYESQYGTFYNFKICYNGVSGFYTSKSQNQTKFVKGQEAEFEEEKKETSNGIIVKIKPVSQSNYQGQGSGGYSKKPTQYASFAVSYTKDLVVAGKIDVGDIVKYAESMYNLMKRLDNS